MSGEGTTSATNTVATSDAAASDEKRRPWLRRALKIGAVVVVIALIWEGAKWLAGDPWRIPAIGYEHNPPFRISQFSDLQLPHLWLPLLRRHHKSHLPQKPPQQQHPHLLRPGRKDLAIHR